MSLERILKKIISDAHDEAERIVVENEKRAEEIKEAARKEASELAEVIMEEAERKSRLEASRIITQARLEKRIHILSRKKEIINDILEIALQKMEFMKKMLKKKIILKDEVREESYEWESMLEELRPKLESDILKILGI